MTDSRAYDPDRLPWLTDERTPRRTGDWGPMLLWALLATVLIAGVSYWIGMRSVAEPDAFADLIGTPPPAATVRLPEAGVAEPPAAQVQPTPMSEVKPVADPAPVAIATVERPRIATAQASRTPAAKMKLRTVPSKARAAPAKRRAATPRPARVEAWPADISAGAYGRVARIGTFSSRRQAKKGWWAIVRHYPGMKRLKAVVTPVPSLRTGQTLYRLQFGTTSQAHSEILCQRMRIIGQSCVVVGLPERQGARR